jgi:hypothetical protein
MKTARNLAVGTAAAVAVIGMLWFSPERRIPTSNLPTRLSDSTFWQMVEEFSEPGGFFRSDNFVSNEQQYQWVIAELKKNRAPGGTYIGVGPDQNFTYLVALQPKAAFIIDIRRQNMIEHLMYKALIEMSADRIDFLSGLFSRIRPEGLSPNDSADTLLQAFDRARPNADLFAENLRSIKEQLTEHHHFVLTEDDLRSLEYVYTAFFDGGPHLTYTSNAGQGAATGFRGSRGMPTYEQLMEETDAEGHNQSYLANAQNFRILQDLEKRNVVIPIVGDFAGPKAVRAVGRYLRDHQATVTAFYTSNVEQYLFQQDDDWSRFYANVETLPLDDQSTFIRSVASRRFQVSRRIASLLCPIQDLLDQFHSGRTLSYAQVIRLSH